MLETVTVNGKMLVITSVVSNQWGYLVVTFGLLAGRSVAATMVDRTLTRAEAIESAISTLTEVGAI